MGRITFLGTGTSTGVPEIGCQCRTCCSNDERDKRFRASALVEYGGEQILIDCGPDFRSQLIRSHIRSIDRIVLTHEHYDHTGGLDDLRPLFYRSRECPIYAEPNVIEAVKRRIPYVFVEHPYPGVPKLELYPVKIGENIKLRSGVEIEPIRVMHYRLPIVGYKFGNMAYITDCKTLPEETIEKIKGIKVLVINALRLYEHPAHLNFDEAMELIKKIEPKHAYLTHIAHTFGKHHEIEALCPEGVSPAFDTLTIDF